jgi:hypothetical protein
MRRARRESWRWVRFAPARKRGHGGDMGRHSGSMTALRIERCDYATRTLPLSPALSPEYRGEGVILSFSLRTFSGLGA